MVLLIAGFPSSSVSAATISKKQFNKLDSSLQENFLNSSARYKVIISKNAPEKGFFSTLISGKPKQPKQVVSDIRGKLSKELKDYIVVELTNDQLVQLTNSDSVDNVYLDQDYTMLLDESVPAMNTSSAWALGYDGSGVRVAVLDTGIDYNNPAFQSRVLASKAFTGENHTDDKQGHGTHVAGTIAGNGRYKGVAPSASLLNAKVLTDKGGGSTSTIIAGIEWAVQSGADVISMSIGNSNGQQDIPLNNAIQAAIDAGVVVIAASGNCGPCRTCTHNGVTSPGNYEEVITVGAVNDNKQYACFSSGEDFVSYIKPDVIAPGVDVISYYAGNTFKSMSGTSMSTPHVAGVAALLLQRNSSLNHYDIKNILESNAVDLGASGKDIQYGSGFVDVSRLFDQNLSYDNISESLVIENNIGSINYSSKSNFSEASHGFIGEMAAYNTLKVGVIFFENQDSMKTFLDNQIKYTHKSNVASQELLFNDEQDYWFWVSGNYFVWVLTPINISDDVESVFSAYLNKYPKIDYSIVKLDEYSDNYALQSTEDMPEVNSTFEDNYQSQAYCTDNCDGDSYKTDLSSGNCHAKINTLLKGTTYNDEKGTKNTDYCLSTSTVREYYLSCDYNSLAWCPTQGFFCYMDETFYTDKACTSWGSNYFCQGGQCITCKSNSQTCSTPGTSTLECCSGTCGYSGKCVGCTDDCYPGSYPSCSGSTLYQCSMQTDGCYDKLGTTCTYGCSNGACKSYCDTNRCGDGSCNCGETVSSCNQDCCKSNGQTCSTPGTSTSECCSGTCGFSGKCVSCVDQCSPSGYPYCSSTTTLYECLMQSDGCYDRLGTSCPCSNNMCTTDPYSKIDLLSYSVDSSTISIQKGGSVILRYEIKNSGTTSLKVGLGASVRDVSGNSYDDPAHDTIVTVTPGSAVYQRTFQTTSSYIEGYYDVAWGLHKVDASNNFIGAIEFSNPFWSEDRFIIASASTCEGQGYSKGACTFLEDPMSDGQCLDGNNQPGDVYKCQAVGSLNCWVKTINCDESNQYCNDPLTASAQCYDYPCTLTKAYWNKATAINGEQVTLTVEGNHCRNTDTANVKVMEVDYLFTSLNDTNMSVNTTLRVNHTDQNDSNYTSQGFWDWLPGNDDDVPGADFGARYFSNGKIQVTWTTNRIEDLDSPYNTYRIAADNSQNGIYEGDLIINDCEITKVEWSKTLAAENEIVGIKVYGNSNCNGKTVAFEVRENDCFGLLADENNTEYNSQGICNQEVNIQPQSATFVNGVASTTWKAEWQSDTLGLSDPEYYAYAIFNNKETKSSNKLDVTNDCKITSLKWLANTVKEGNTATVEVNAQGSCQNKIVNIDIYYSTLLYDKKLESLNGISFGSGIKSVYSGTTNWVAKYAENGKYNEFYAFAAVDDSNFRSTNKILLTAECYDKDGDGYMPSGYCNGNDCDDTNPKIYPGATELCNGKDDDCDGLTDEDITFDTNEFDCGRCGNVCSEGQSCYNGVCTASKVKLMNYSLINNNVIKGESVKFKYIISNTNGQNEYIGLGASVRDRKTGKVYNDLFNDIIIKSYPDIRWYSRNFSTSQLPAGFYDVAWGLHNTHPNTQSGKWTTAIQFSNPLWKENALHITGCGDGVCEESEKTTCLLDCNATITCPAGSKFSCDGREILQCVINNGKMSSIPLGYCRGATICSSTTGTCIPYTYKTNLRLEDAENGVTVLKQAGDYLTLTFEHITNEEIMINYNSKIFTLLDGPCYTDYIQIKNDTKCTFYVLGEPGTYTFGVVGGNSEKVKIIDDPSLLVITNKNKLYERFKDDTLGVKKLLKQAYQTAIANGEEGIVYNVEDYLLGHPWASYEEYKSSKNKNLLEDNYTSEVSSLINYKCSDCKNVLILGDDYVLPYQRRDFVIRTDWQYDSGSPRFETNNLVTDTAYTPITTPTFADLDTDIFFSKGKILLVVPHDKVNDASISLIREALFNTYGYKQCSCPSSGYGRFNFCFSPDYQTIKCSESIYGSRCQDAEKENCPQNAYYYDTLKLYNIGNPDIDSLEDIQIFDASKIGCNSFRDLDKSTLILIGNDEDNNAIKCLPWVSHENYPQLSIQRNVWDARGHSLVLNIPSDSTSELTDSSLYLLRLMIENGRWQKVFGSYSEVDLIQLGLLPMSFIAPPPFDAVPDLYSARIDCLNIFDFDSTWHLQNFDGTNIVYCALDGLGVLISGVAFNGVRTSLKGIKQVESMTGEGADYAIATTRLNPGEVNDFVTYKGNILTDRTDFLKKQGKALSEIPSPTLAERRAGIKSQIDSVFNGFNLEKAEVNFDDYNQFLTRFGLADSYTSSKSYIKYLQDIGNVGSKYKSLMYYSVPEFRAHLVFDNNFLKSNGVTSLKDIENIRSNYVAGLDEMSKIKKSMSDITDIRFEDNLRAAEKFVTTKEVGNLADAMKSINKQLPTYKLVNGKAVSTTTSLKENLVYAFNHFDIGQNKPPVHFISYSEEAYGLTDAYEFFNYDVKEMKMQIPFLITDRAHSFLIPNDMPYLTKGTVFHEMAHLEFDYRIGYPIEFLTIPGKDPDSYLGIVREFYEYSAIKIPTYRLGDDTIKEVEYLKSYLDKNEVPLKSIISLQDNLLKTGGEELIAKHAAFLDSYKFVDPTNIDPALKGTNLENVYSRMYDLQKALKKNMDLLAQTPDFNAKIIRSNKFKDILTSTPLDNLGANKEKIRKAIDDYAKLAITQ